MDEQGSQHLFLRNGPLASPRSPPTHTRLHPTRPRRSKIAPTFRQRILLVSLDGARLKMQRKEGSAVFTCANV